ncbi:MAG: MFS transporter [Chloroflexota bacterium]
MSSVTAPLQLRLQILYFTFTRVILNTTYRMAYPFLGVFARSLGVDLQTMSFALTARSVAGGFGPFMASIADTRGRKFGMLAGLGMFICGVVLVVFWPVYPSLVVSLILTTLGKYLFDPSMQAYLGDRVPYERRGRTIAVTEFGWSLAFILGVPVMGFLIARHGWLAPFPLLTVLGLLLFASLWTFLPNDRSQSASSIHPGYGSNLLKSNFHIVLTSAPALAGLAVGFLATIANESVNLVFGVWLEDSFGLQIGALGASAAVIGIAELSGEGMVAAFVDRLGKPRALAIGLISNSLAALLLPLLGHSEIGALVGLFLFYITFEFTIVSIIPMMTEILPQARATMMAFNVGALSLGRALGAPLTSWLYGFGFPIVAAAAVVFNMIALLSLQRLQAMLASRD